MPGTNVWSVVFSLAAILVALVVIRVLITMWAQYFKNVNAAIEKDVSIPSWLGLALGTALTIGGLVLVATLGWNAMVNATTSRSDYKAPAEVQEQKKVHEAQMPSTEQLDAARAEQKDRVQDKPHQKALDSFDESMAREAEKIKQRNK